MLAVVGDDRGCKSSTLPHPCERAFVSASATVLQPANVQEVLDSGLCDWALSRHPGRWIGLEPSTENCDSSACFDLDPGRVQMGIPTEFELPHGGVHARWHDKRLDQEARLYPYKINAAREFACVNGLNHIAIDSPNAAARGGASAATTVVTWIDRRPKTFTQMGGDWPSLVAPSYEVRRESIRQSNFSDVDIRRPRVCSPNNRGKATLSSQAASNSIPRNGFKRDCSAAPPLSDLCVKRTRDRPAARPAG